MPVLIERQTNNLELEKLLDRARAETTNLVQKMFREGAYFTHMGSELYIGDLPHKLLHGYQQQYDQGRVVSCLPVDIESAHQPSKSQPEIHIIPSGSNKRLAYRIDRRHRNTGFLLLYGIDNDGKPIIEGLHQGSHGVLLGIREYVKNGIFKNAQIDPVMFPPVRMIGQALFDMAKNEGLGEISSAVEKLRKSSSRTV